MQEEEEVKGRKEDEAGIGGENGEVNNDEDDGDDDEDEQEEAVGRMATNKRKINEDVIQGPANKRMALKCTSHMILCRLFVADWKT
ncbi:major centromere autoantigen B-like [Anabrus simplex]|uniref:major centromere autoantigen B-like n=1 Tax=Anabrus simplex TaxID=316456 RepID=UPI0034DDACFC